MPGPPNKCGNCGCENCEIFADAGPIATTTTGYINVGANSGTTGHGRAVVTGKSSASGGNFAVYGSYVDANNNARAELTINGASSTLKLWKLVSGSPTQLGSTYTFTGATNTNYTIEVCWDGTSASAMLNNINDSVMTGAFTGTGNQAAIGANPNSGTVTFQNFLFSKHSSDSSGCTQCSITNGACSTAGSNCVGGNAPKYLRVVINFSTGGTCNSICTPAIGSFVIPSAGVQDQGAGSGSILQCIATCCDWQPGPWQCWWLWGTSFYYTHSCGGINPALMNIKVGLLAFDDGYRLEGELRFQDLSTGDYITVLKSSVLSLSPLNCLTAFDSGITLSPVCTLGSNTVCAISGMTFTVYRA